MTCNHSSLHQPVAGCSGCIRNLNDAFRQVLAGGRVYYTPGVSGLGAASMSAALHAVETFDNFNEGNDPYGEHDFGSITVAGEKLFWKIDYYDTAMEFGSGDPADPTKTTRVLTLMLASEY